MSKRKSWPSTSLSGLGSLVQDGWKIAVNIPLTLRKGKRKSAFVNDVLVVYYYIIFYYHHGQFNKKTESKTKKDGKGLCWVLLLFMMKKRNSH